MFYGFKKLDTIALVCQFTFQMWEREHLLSEQRLCWAASGWASPAAASARGAVLESGPKLD